MSVNGLNGVTSGLAKHRTRVSAPDTDVLISSGVCIVIATIFCLRSEQCVHWFLLPIICCGALIGADAVAWVRGRTDVFDPVGILGLFGFHFFFLAPLLHITWEHWSYRNFEFDRRAWMGAMATLNLVGLLLYRLFSRRSTESARAPRRQTVWICDQRAYAFTTGLLLLVCAGFQIWVYTRFHGIGGLIAAHTEGVQSFDGTGWIFTLADSFPILAVMALCVYWRRRKQLRSPFAQAAVFCGSFLLLLFIVGLRGSRSSTVWALFWVVGMIHLYVSPVPRRLIYIGAATLLLFMYFYGFYKSAGLDAISAVEDSEYRSFLSRKTGRTAEQLLLEDFGRADIQAFVLYTVMETDTGYRLAWGRTYLAAAASIIPRALWPDRPATTVKEGTEIEGLTYIPYKVQSSFVYGLAGEGMLNFGPLIVPFAFACFGVLVRLLRRFMFTLTPGDIRWLLVPWLVYTSVQILGADADNIVSSVVKDGLLPVSAVLLGSKRYLNRVMKK